MFVCVQLYAWAFEPDYNEQYMFHYLDREATEVYEIPTQNFLPAVAICDDYYKAVVGGDISDCNNPDHWSIWFEQSVDDVI